MPPEDVPGASGGGGGKQRVFWGILIRHPWASRVSGLVERARGDRYGQVPKGCNLMIETFLVLKNCHNISPEIYQNNINEMLRNNSDQKTTYSS